MSVRTYLLAAGTSDFVVSGVLLDVSGKLGVSLTAAGQLATAFAISPTPSVPRCSGFWSARSAPSSPG
jgi:DHA1 family purine base/nucleoside efflux pump-like MFS transporter